ncbi:MAG TPA: hypothetical protein VD997_11440 [Phycisphaerales bacterium]|nr:hypothetical protein [Phycisphaerales bacterium]
MELNRRTKLAGGVLALAVAALIYDRVIAGDGPASAEASAPAAKPPALGDAEREKSGPENPNHRGALAAQLTKLGEADQPMWPSTRDDAFVAPATWFPADEEPSSHADSAAASAKSASHYVINSVLMDRGTNLISSVTVDNKALRPGLPVKVDAGGKVRTYELVRAWIDEAKVTHVELKVDGKLIEIRREPGDRPAGKDRL